MEEKELRLPAVKKETTSSQGFDILLTQEQLFNTIQEREIGEEVAQLEKELEKIRLKKVGYFQLFAMNLFKRAKRVQHVGRKKKLSLMRSLSSIWTEIHIFQ